MTCPHCLQCDEPHLLTIAGEPFWEGSRLCVRPSLQLPYVRSVWHVVGGMALLPSAGGTYRAELYVADWCIATLPRMRVILPARPLSHIELWKAIGVLRHYREHPPESPLWREARYERALARVAMGTALPKHLRIIADGAPHSP